MESLPFPSSSVFCVRAVSEVPRQLLPFHLEMKCVVSSKNTRGVILRVQRSLQGADVSSVGFRETPYFCSPDAALGTPTWGDRYNEDCKMQWNKFCFLTEIVKTKRSVSINQIFPAGRRI